RAPRCTLCGQDRMSGFDIGTAAGAVARTICGQHRVCVSTLSGAAVIVIKTPGSCIASNHPAPVAEQATVVSGLLTAADPITVWRRTRAAVEVAAGDMASGLGCRCCGD